MPISVVSVSMHVHMFRTDKIDWVHIGWLACGCVVVYVNMCVHYSVIVMYSKTSCG